MQYNPPKVSIVILDFNRPKEAELLLKSLKSNAKFPHEIVYLSNGGEQEYVLDFYKNGLVDRLILNKENNGCGLGTRQGFQSAMCEWVIYAQVDQWLGRELHEINIEAFTQFLEINNKTHLYIDLAGDQGNGNFSERALFINRKRYLEIPELDKTIGGPGPWANYRWTENLVQEYMKEAGLTFLTGESVYCFGNNGKWSQRSYPCGGETVHATDTKILKVIKPLKQKYLDFPNLKLNDQEWELVLSGNWPEEGKIPEADLKDSFTCWKE